MRFRRIIIRRAAAMFGRVECLLLYYVSYFRLLFQGYKTNYWEKEDARLRIILGLLWPVSDRATAGAGNGLHGHGRRPARALPNNLHYTRLMALKPHAWFISKKSGPICAPSASSDSSTHEQLESISKLSTIFALVGHAALPPIPQ